MCVSSSLGAIIALTLFELASVASCFAAFSTKCFISNLYFDNTGRGELWKFLLVCFDAAGVDGVKPLVLNFDLISDVLAASNAERSSSELSEFSSSSSEFWISR